MKTVTLTIKVGPMLDGDMIALAELSKNLKRQNYLWQVNPTLPSKK